jgi:hypothetical protein
MAADTLGGELQTLISTLQNGNQQLGHIYRATAGLTPALSDVATRLSAVAQGSLGPRLGEVVQRTGLPPVEPDGYITIDIPGVGPRLIPYYPV